MPGQGGSLSRRGQSGRSLSKEGKCKILFKEWEGVNHSENPAGTGSAGKTDERRTIQKVGERGPGKRRKKRIQNESPWKKKETGSSEGGGGGGGGGGAGGGGGGGGKHRGGAGCREPKKEIDSQPNSKKPAKALWTLERMTRGSVRTSKGHYEEGAFFEKTCLIHLKKVGIDGGKKKKSQLSQGLQREIGGGLGKRKNRRVFVKSTGKRKKREFKKAKTPNWNLASKNNTEGRGTGKKGWG